MSQFRTPNAGTAWNIKHRTQRTKEVEHERTKKQQQTIQQHVMIPETKRFMFNPKKQNTICIV